MDDQHQASGLGSTDFFAESLLHESIRESGTPYRFTANGAGVNRIQQSEQQSRSKNREHEAGQDGSDIFSVYNSL